MNTGNRVVCFGEMLLRLSAPQRGHLFQEPRLDAHFGGAEANVAVALARLGLSAALVTIVPDGVIGTAAIESVARAGVDVTGVQRGEGRLGLYFLAPSAGLRSAEITYDRLDSIFASTPAERFDWPRLLEGASWLHLSGIIPAIGPETARLSLVAIAAARACGVRVSFDGNYRASMWARWCTDPAAILAKHVEGADLLFGGHRDISLLLGRSYAGNGSQQRRTAALAAFKRFPRLAAIAATTRQIVSSGHHRLSARLDTPSTSFETDAVDVMDIVDRIGTGDAFAAGVLAKIDAGVESAANAGLALSALKHATHGDQSFTTAADLAAIDFIAGDVRR